jgi:sporulation protein YlmC with PRC-barrel domain
VKRLTELPGKRVVDENGRELGTLIDLRARLPRKQARGDDEAVASLVYGHIGWLERAGLRTAEERTVAWRDVVRTEPGRVVVRAKRNA